MVLWCSEQNWTLSRCPFSPRQGPYLARALFHHLMIILLKTFSSFSFAPSPTALYVICSDFNDKRWWLVQCQWSKNNALLWYCLSSGVWRNFPKTHIVAQVTPAVSGCVAHAHGVGSLSWLSKHSPLPARSLRCSLPVWKLWTSVCKVALELV